MDLIVWSMNTYSGAKDLLAQRSYVYFGCAEVKSEYSRTALTCAQALACAQVIPETRRNFGERD